MNWKALVAVGVLSVLAGILALVFPLPASLTVNAFVGASLLAVGVLGAWGAMTAAEGSDRLWGVLLGIATLVLGALLLFNPVEGLQTLTLLLGIGFLASGLFKLILGWQQPLAQWKWAVILSGAVSIVLALMIFTGMPQAAIVVPGILLAVELLSYGWGLIFLGLAWRRRGGL